MFYVYVLSVSNALMLPEIAYLMGGWLDKSDNEVQNIPLLFKFYTFYSAI